MDAEPKAKKGPRGPKPAYARSNDYHKGAPRLATRVNPEVLAWIESRPEGTRPFIERLVREDRECVEDPDGWAFSLAIARGLYDYAYNCQIPTLNSEWRPNPLASIYESGNLAAAEKISKLSSIWEQICSLYVTLELTVVQALGFSGLVDKFDDQSKQLGMKWRFQKEFENFVFRLYALLERLAQLSNVYHDKGLAINQIHTSNYWNNLRTQNGPDAYLDAIEKFLALDSVVRLMQLRRQMTHHFELDMVGIGWPTLKLEKHPLYEQLNIGQQYEGKVAFEQGVRDIETVYRGIVTLLSEVDAIITK